MKKVLVTQRLHEAESYREVRDSLDVRWAEFLHQVGLLLFPVPSHFPVDSIWDMAPWDGVIFTGGGDIGQVHDDPLSRRRDDMEIKILSRAIEQDLPVVGICRGMQLIASQFGANCQSCTGHVATRHVISPTKDTVYDSYLEALQNVNSFHNQAIQNVTGELRVSATSDGVVEAIEHRRLRLFACMWHPERETPYREPDLQFFRGFFGVEA